MPFGDYSTFEHYFYIAGFSFSKIQTDRYSLDRVGFFGNLQRLLSDELEVFAIGGTINSNF